MKELTPNYYNKFRCIADRCKHSCCKGWEIDIDERTLSLYNSLDTPMGNRIRSNIEGETPHFVLCEDERCPFLNEKGLCDIITECGEDALCDICSLHPRFSSFFDSFTETGLGLCCEEAARIVLTETESFSIEAPCDESITPVEREFLDIRNEIFDVLQDREKGVSERFYTLSEMFGFEFNFPLHKLCDLYLSLERLDDKWTQMLCELKKGKYDISILDNMDYRIPFEQLSVYFIFRHLSDAVFYGDYAERVRFALMSCCLIALLCTEIMNKNGSITMEQLAEVVRMYSSEIEYSEDNMEELLYLNADYFK